ncbi:glutathione-dependent formaldehyde-activating [Cryomyces antarcticus]
MDASCQCDSVKFRTPLSKPLDLYHCHCLECRKQSACAYGTSAIFPKFALPSDQPISCYTRKTDSGNTLDCYFCSVCGTRVMHSRRGGQTVSVKGGCIEGLDWASAKHIWCCRAVAAIREGVQRWEKEPDLE